MIGLAGVSVVVVSAGSLFAPTLLPRFGQIDELFHASAKPASGSVSAAPTSHDNGATANRDAATTRPPEEQDDFLTRWGTNDIDAKADPKPGTGPPAAKQDDLPPPSDANENNVRADHNAETREPVAETNVLPPRSDANDKNASANRDADTAPVMKEQDNPVVRPSDPNPPARRDDADDLTTLLEHVDKTDASAVMHAKGIIAYRKGDLDAALADLSRAIELNPTFMLAYINRGIVRYRMGKLDLALADVARAKRIDRTGHGRPTAAVHGRRRRDAFLIESPAFMQAAGL
jgi:hypothetical protein